MKKYKIIIDTDPGVDDTTALMLVLFDNSVDIKLITTVSGNVPVQKSTRNACHILDLFGKNIPVAMGANKPLFREPIHATHMHGEEGLGGYIPPAKTRLQPLDIDAVEAMYQVITENPHEITLFVWGPHTNVAKLLSIHPECALLLERIIFMGASPYGMLDMPQHISFNIKNDPEAFQIVLDSGIPLVMIPSYVGRRVAHLTEEQVKDLELTSSVGKFLATMFETYWEPNCEDKRIATNDNCALFFLKHPKMFQLQRADILVDVDQTPGKTYARFHKRGNVNVVVGLDREKYLDAFYKALDNVNVILDDKIYDLTNQAKKA